MSDSFPNIYLFNPTCEFAIANGNSNWHPNRLLQIMEDNLSILTLYFSCKNDIVLVENPPSKKFLESLMKIKAEIPRFEIKNAALNNQKILTLPKNKLLPWGWSPAAHKLLFPFKESCSPEFKNSPVFNWKAEHKEITSRKFASKILKQVIAKCSADYIIPSDLAPKVCTSQTDIEEAIQEWGNIMIKAPWSSSGRGLQPITKTPVHQKIWEKVMGIINEQGYVMVEPFLNKKIDLSLQFEIQKGKVEFLGVSRFYNNKKGQYNGNYLNGWPTDTEKELVDFAGLAPKSVLQLLINELESSKMAYHYEGVFGVDMLVYSDKNHLLKINPCLEINMRHTMGLLAIRVEKFLMEGSQGIFSTFFQPGKSFKTFTREMEKNYPITISQNKIKSGFLALTDSTDESQFGAYILVQ